jgi:hypothetical protein
LLNGAGAAQAAGLDYQPVKLCKIPDGIVVDLVVDDRVHILSELVDKGLANSGPESSVAMHGRIDRRGRAVQQLHDRDTARGPARIVACHRSGTP